MSNERNTYTITDEYFKKLDAAPISPDGFFTSENDKERYETQIMYAFRKYRSSLYHYNNVLGLLQKDEDSAIRASRRTNEMIQKKGMQKAEVVVGFSVTKDEYVYELAAFLEAIKSSVDFLAIVCAKHLPRIRKLTSINTLMKCVRKKRAGSIYDEVKKHLEWLDYMRSYRHHVVHRSIITVNLRRETRAIGGESETYQFPIVIPQNPPRYVPDTREARAMEDGGEGINCIESKEWIETANGKRKVLNQSMSFFASKGYVVLQQFMEQQIESYVEFAEDIITALSNLNFQEFHN